MIRSSVVVLGAVLIALSCGKLPPSVGKSRDVVVVSVIIDSALIGGGLQTVHRYPQPEPVFNFLYAADTALKRYRTFRTIFLYGSLRERGINRLLDADARAAIVKDNVALFKKNDLWARDQLVLILAVAEPQMLWDAFKEYRPLIGRILDEYYRARVKQEYYQTPIDELTKKHLRRFGATFDLHDGWLIDSTHAEQGFVFVHTHYPDRSIFFYKEVKTKVLTDSMAVRKRDNLTRRFYHGDYIMNGLTTAQTVQFSGRSAIQLQGVWQNDSLIAGGPFLTYLFTVADTLYIVDGILFLPGERKTEFLTKLDIALNSFQIVPADTTGFDR